MERSYKNALVLLNLRRRKARPTSVARHTPDSTSNSNSTSIATGNATNFGVPSLRGMKEWLQALGHSDADLNRLNVIHVAGTKGKGSTCAFASSFLERHGAKCGFPRKVGFYTSPHLKDTRERIQINSTPLSEERFANYFFEVWDKLLSNASGSQPDYEKTPRYLQLLALLSVHVFLREKVDAAVIETHHGGEFDATNFFQHPIATGITTIGIDHVDQLGPSIDRIAWHKAGIFKAGAPAFSALQVAEAAATLQQRADEKGVMLEFVDVNPMLPKDAYNLKPDVQRANASLALALVTALLSICAPEAHNSLDESEISEGVDRFSFPGRFHHIVDGNNEWFLDGAHNELSIRVAARWFADAAAGTQKTSPTRILIFSHTSERDGKAILACLAKTLKQSGVRVNHVIFSSYEEKQDDTATSRNLKEPNQELTLQNQREYAELWRRFDPEAKVSIQSMIDDALELARQTGHQDGGMQTLVTGSLYLVGGALRLLERETLDPQVRAEKLR